MAHFTEQNKENFSSHALWFQVANRSFHNIMEPTQMAVLNGTQNWQSCCLPDEQYARLLEIYLVTALWEKVSFSKTPVKKQLEFGSKR